MSFNGGPRMLYAGCSQIAADSYYTYFGLQHFNDGDGECWLSNNLTQVTKYGNVDVYGRAIISYVSQVDNKIYGGPWANAVYMVSKAVDIEHFIILVFMRQSAS